MLQYTFNIQEMSNIQYYIKTILEITNKQLANMTDVEKQSYKICTKILNEYLDVK